MTTTEKPTWNRQEQWAVNAAHLLNQRNCKILWLPTDDRRFGTKVKCPTGRASFWVKFPTVRSLTRVKCPGIAWGGGGWAVLELTGTLLHLWLLPRKPLDYCSRFRNIANVCLTNECSRDTSENPALRNLGLLPFYIPVLHIFPYLLSASNPPAKHPPCWTWIPQSLGLFGSPRPCGSVRPRTNFFSDRK